MAIAAASLLQVPEGVSHPRVAPPLPARSLLAQWEAATAKPPIPWQPIAARYMMAIRPDGRWLYPDVCIVAGRQNGKTELLLPRILHDLRQGRRTLHTAHRMRLVRKLFTRVARVAEQEGAKIRYTHGEEEITHPSGGSYATVAALRGARGDSTDTLIIDETAEFEDYEAMEAAIPTLAASPNGQTIFLSTAGKDSSIVLNALRRRSEEGDPSLAYLEWSARPDRSLDDVEGWAEANPSLGHFPGMYEFLSKQRKMYAEDPIGFAREHLSRWDPRTQNRVVPTDAWTRCHAEVGAPEKPSMGINMDAEHGRASAVLAWRMADGRVACEQLVDAHGEPALDTDALRDALRKMATKHRVRKVAYAAWTDAVLARGWATAKAMDGKEFAVACGTFSELVSSGRLAWSGNEDLIGEDLAFCVRKAHESGAWVAVPASQERPVTAALAAIRAVYLAGAPKPPLPRIG